MTVATCVCCSMISEIQIAYGSRVPCHGRWWRPWRRCQAMSVAAKPVIDTTASPPEQSLQLVLETAAALVLAAAQALLELFAHRRFDLLLRRLGGDGGEIELVRRIVEPAGHAHRYGHALEIREFAPALPLRRADDRSAYEVIDGVGCDVDVALAADAQQRRLHVEIAVVRDAVADREARAQFRKIGLFRLVRRLHLLAAQRAEPCARTANRR